MDKERRTRGVRSYIPHPDQIEYYYHDMNELRYNKVVDFDSHKEEIMNIISYCICDQLKHRCPEIRIKRYREGIDDQRLFQNKFEIRFWFDSDYSILYVYYKMNNQLQSMFEPYVDIYYKINKQIMNRIKTEFGYHVLCFNGSGSIRYIHVLHNYIVNKHQYDEDLFNNYVRYVDLIPDAIPMFTVAAVEGEYSDYAVQNGLFMINMVHNISCSDIHMLVRTKHEPDWLRDLAEINAIYFGGGKKPDAIRLCYNEYRDIISREFDFKLPEFITKEQQCIGTIEWEFAGVNNLEEVILRNDQKFKTDN